MAEAERITARQRAILTAIVENYIETGEPVGSGTIAGTIARVLAGGGHGASGLSSATVRNEMAEWPMQDCWSSRTRRQDECRRRGRFACM